MVVIRQVKDKIRHHCPRRRVQLDHSRDEESRTQQKSKRSASTSTGGLQDKNFIVRLWETEGLSAVKKAFNENERKRKREKECTAHAHGQGHASLLHNHFRHDGHFTTVSPKLKHIRRELDQDENQAKLRFACCRDCLAQETSTGISDGDEGLQEAHCGLQSFGGKDGARPRSHVAGSSTTEQAQCFDSLFDLLKIEPRKLRTGFKSRGYKYMKPGTTRVLTPCVSVESMQSSHDSLLSSSLQKHPTNDNDFNKLDDETSCETLTDISTSDSSSGSPGKLPERQESAPQTQGSPRITYEAADQLSPRQYGLYEMANVWLRPSSQRLANQFRNLEIRNGFPESQRATARISTEALRDAHIETLQKARHPGTSTQLDNMKASILCHGFYPRLLEAYIRHRREGASPELKKRLSYLQTQVRDWKPSNITDFNADETVNKFHSMITAYEKDLERPFQNSMKFCDGLDKELESLELTTRAASAIRISQQHFRSVPDINTSTRKPVWR